MNKIEEFRYKNERGVEIHYAKEFFNINGGNICEVGAVLRHWGDYKSHETIDKTEVGEGIINEDATKLSYVGKNVMCISTVEHMGFVDVYNKFEFGNTDRDNGINFIKKIDSEANSYLITWPVGYCKDLDTWFFNNKEHFNYHIYQTNGSDDNWYLCDNEDIWSEMKYIAVPGFTGSRYSVINGLIVMYKIGDNE